VSRVNRNVPLRPKLSTLARRETVPQWLVQQKPRLYSVDRKGAMPKPIKFGEKPQQ